MAGRDLYPLFETALSAGLRGRPARVIAACSGGPDSMVLADLLRRWRARAGSYVCLGHVDHGLRGRASRADAAHVRRWAERNGLSFKIVSAGVRTWAAREKRGLEEAGRILRYRALAKMARDLKCGAVVTAHTLDDQAETIFLNLIRGSGPSGLSGMAPVSEWPVKDLRSPVPSSSRPLLLRPLLGATRQDVLNYLRTRRIPFRIDASNRDPVFFRNRIRPALKRWERDRPGFFERVGRLAELQRDEEDFWERRWGSARGLFRRKRGLSALDLRIFLRYHKVEQRRALRRAFGLSHFAALERARAFALSKDPAPRASLPGGWVEKQGRFLVFRPLGGLPDTHQRSRGKRP